MLRWNEKDLAEKKKKEAEDDDDDEEGAMGLSDCLQFPKARDYKTGNR